MKEIEIENWPRKKTYEWFKTFTNTTYGCNVKIDVTKLVNYSKEKQTSFFINMLYVVTKSLNSIDEMRMRYIDEKPYIFSDINPAFTVMTESGTFENVRHKNEGNYKDFYKIAKKNLDNAKKQKKLNKSNYNPENCYNEYYVTCLPWLDFTSITHPIPDDKSSQSIPRICWGKYEKTNDKYSLVLNITVSHLFVDGKPLSDAFIKIQENINNIENLTN